MTERIQFVDENDMPIGGGTRQEAWEKGIYKRVVLILLTDGVGKILLQKRGDDKEIYPGAWTTTASGHSDEGETYEETAHRELFEETGLRAELSYAGKVRREGQEGDKSTRVFHAVFLGTIEPETEMTLEEGEVTDLRWFAIQEVLNDIKMHPDQYTPGLREALKFLSLK